MFFFFRRARRRARERRRRVWALGVGRLVGFRYKGRWRIFSLWIREAVVGEWARVRRVCDMGSSLGAIAFGGDSGVVVGWMPLGGDRGREMVDVTCGEFKVLACRLPMF